MSLLILVCAAAVTASAPAQPTWGMLPINHREYLDGVDQRSRLSFRLEKLPGDLNTAFTLVDLTATNFGYARNARIPLHEPRGRELIRKQGWVRWRFSNGRKDRRVTVTWRSNPAGIKCLSKQFAAGPSTGYFPAYEWRGTWEPEIHATPVEMSYRANYKHRVFWFGAVPLFNSRIARAVARNDGFMNRTRGR